MDRTRTSLYKQGDMTKNLINKITEEMLICLISTLVLPGITWLINTFVKFELQFQVIIHIEDVNDNLPYFIGTPYKVSIEEEKSKQCIQKISVHDKDENDKVFYRPIRLLSRIQDNDLIM